MTDIEVVLGDITDQDVDAIVTAANESLLGWRSRRGDSPGSWAAAGRGGRRDRAVRGRQRHGHAGIRPGSAGASHHPHGRASLGRRQPQPCKAVAAFALAAYGLTASRRRHGRSMILAAPAAHSLRRDVLNSTLPDAGLPHLRWGRLVFAASTYFHSFAQAFTGLL
jgi:hypothetical protein